MITLRKLLQKRSWMPLFTKDGKGYIRYDSSYYSKQNKDDQLHEVRTMKLTPDHTYSGRSASNMVFKDEDGTYFTMTLNGGMDLVKKLIAKEIECDGIYLVADFMQVKKGSNLFIAVYEE